MFMMMNIMLIIVVNGLGTTIHRWVRRALLPAHLRWLDQTNFFTLGKGEPSHWQGIGVLFGLERKIDLFLTKLTLKSQPVEPMGSTG